MVKMKGAGLPCSGKHLVATGDHPLPVKGKGRVCVSDLKTGDKLRSVASQSMLTNSAVVHHIGDSRQLDPLWLNSVLALDEQSDEWYEITEVKRLAITMNSYDVETESDHFTVSGIDSHNCRTRVIGNAHDPEREVVAGRGNLSFTSINLPRIAINAKGDVNCFMEDLSRKLDLVTRQLLDRFEIQCSKKVKNFPFLMGEGVWLDSEQLEGPDASIAEVLKHGSLSIGFIGLAEALVALTGKHHGEDEASRELGLDIISFMRGYTDRMAKQTGLNFTLLASPAEGLSGRFVQIDKKLFGEIKGVTDRGYYTNGFHVPVHFPISAFEKIRIEAPYHALTNAGHITYIELDGNARANPAAFESVIRAMKESGIGYGSVNHPLDRDPVCGYRGIIEDECPGCGRRERDGGPKFERIRRITGYLVGTMDRWNDGKTAEERDRVKHGLA
jgi:ribonucleoside-triphosphate reductase